MSWTALVPLKAAGARKERLAERLDAAARDALAAAMFGHVVAVLADCPIVSRTVVLSGQRPASWDGAWLLDRGDGLNEALEAARGVLEAGRLLVLHADLPWLARADIASLLDAAERAGAAIAPDRHGRGTNSLATTSHSAPAFAFGPGSFARHRAALPDAAIVERRGLACDLDTPGDLDEAAPALALLRAA